MGPGGGQGRRGTRAGAGRRPGRERLGRGGGSYDRALARVGPLIPLIALVYDGELLDHVPAQPHDVPVRAAVSPANGITVVRAG